MIFPKILIVCSWWSRRSCERGYFRLPRRLAALARKPAQTAGPFQWSRRTASDL